MNPDPRTLAALEALIGFDTVSRNSNLACIDWARAHLEAHGARTLMDWNDDRTKANLFATFGEGPGGIVLSGHVDVVPVDGQAWTSDPFRAVVRDGKVFGRGACDMKGFDAVVLAHAPDMGGAALKQPIHVALTYDEELGCLGIPRLIAALDRAGIKPAGAIIGEATSMRLVSAHKGGAIYRCRVTGAAAHSSLTPKAVNAIEYAALIVARIRAIADRFGREGPFDDGFEVPYTTISTNLFSGGNGANIVPAASAFLFDYRYVPGVDPEAIIAEIEAYAGELIAQMHAVDAGAGIAFERINAVPALAVRETDAVYRLALGLLDDKRVGKVSYGTEASFFQDYGVPSVVCGPGSIAQAHKPDEFVTLEQLALCDRFVEGVIERLAVR